MLIAAILPLVVSLFLHVPRLALDNFTDAVFYLSYARQFDELVSRYGFLYYSTRFGGILPDVLSGWIFGEINGIWILRWGLSVGVSLGLFLFFRKRYGLLQGVIASLLWSFNPADLRLLCTTYVDSTAVPFIILGCLLFASRTSSLIFPLASGVLFALAASAQLYAAFALLLLSPWLICSLWEDRGVLKGSLIWSGVGFLGTFLIGWVWYWAEWGMPALFSPTIELMRDLGSGQAALWKKPLGVALKDCPAWFAPLALLPAFGMLWKRGSHLLRGGALSVLASTAFFWGGDLFGNAYVLSMPFYYSVIELASALGKELPKAPSDREVMRFWYDDDLTKPGGSERRMIGAFWLHTFGKLTGYKDGYVLFPQMDPRDAEAVRFSGVERIVIFDQDHSQVEKALKHIEDHGLPFQVSKRFLLSARSDNSRKLEVAILERTIPTLEQKISNLDPNQLRVFHGGKVVWKGEALELTSGAIKWWDFAKLPLGDLKKGDGLHLRFRIEEGMIRFSLNDKKENLEHVEKWTSDGDQVVELVASRDISDAFLSLHSMYPNGARSRLVIETIEKMGPSVR